MSSNLRTDLPGARTAFSWVRPRLYGIGDAGGVVLGEEVELQASLSSSLEQDTAEEQPEVDGAGDEGVMMDVTASCVGAPTLVLRTASSCD